MSKLAKPLGNRILTLLLLILAGHGFSQGFSNLNFEQAKVVLAYPPSPGIILASNAIPSWSAYTGPTGNPTNSSSVGALTIFYNGQSLGGAIVALQDTNAISYGPLQGKYSVLLQGSIPAAGGTASIGQTGTIPNTAKSLTFIGALPVAFQISFSGQQLTYLVTGSTANYITIAADVSTYAGQTGQLLFTAPVGYSALLDNIQFSSESVPEPTTLALLGVAALLGFFRFTERPIACDPSFHQ